MTGKPKRAALYVRVSTDGQTVDNQRLALEAVCEQRGWQVVQVYADNGISGAKGRKPRPRPGCAAEGCLSRAVQRCPRLGAGSPRSFVAGPVRHAERIGDGGCRPGFTNKPSTLPPLLDGYSSRCVAFAEFERAMIRSRVKAGLERAKARGVRLGRPRTGAKDLRGNKRIGLAARTQETNRDFC